MTDDPSTRSDPQIVNIREYDSSEGGRKRNPTPCPESLDGPFLSIRSTGPVTIHCGGLKGHAGPHFVRVEWDAAP